MVEVVNAIIDCVKLLNNYQYRPPEAGDRVLGCIRPARRCGSARLGSDWLGSVRLGSVRLGSVRFGSTVQHIHHDFTISTLCMFCIKTNEFPKSEGTGHAGCQNDAVPEAAKIDTSFRILIFEKNWTFSKMADYLNQNNYIFHLRGQILWQKKVSEQCATVWKGNNFSATQIERKFFSGWNEYLLKKTVILPILEPTKLILV